MDRGVSPGGPSGQWLYVTGMLNQDTYAPELDSAVLVGFPAARKYLAFDGHIRAQFLAEAILLSLAGGTAGVAIGIAATAAYAGVHGEAVIIPPDTWAGGLAGAVIIGALAGLLPAIRAARLSPTQALWTV